MKNKLSVIIPTHGRPEYLPRAIDSALGIDVSGGVEVLVIPNGPDKSWLEVKENYKNNSNVRFIYCEKPHGNAARNLGLKNANGTFIRFLDDDDYLYSSLATKQLEQLEKNGADVSSGMVEIKDEDGNEYGICSFPDDSDYVSANASISGITLPLGNLYRRESIKIKWDESINRAQDYIFILDLIISTELSWHKFNHVVGCWFQHNQGRVSYDQNKNKENKKIMYWCFDRLVMVYDTLKDNGRLNSKRHESISKSLWSFIDHNYYKDKVKVRLMILTLQEKGIIYNELGNKVPGIKFTKEFLSKYPMLYLSMKPMLKYIKVTFSKRTDDGFVRKL